MHVNRRYFLGAAAAFGLVATRSWAITEIGFEDFSIRSVSDGKLVLPMQFLLPEGADRAEIAPLLAASGISGDSYESPLNVTLMRRGDDLILFDVGSGPDFMPSAGELPSALEAAGIAPGDVTHVVFTHAHPDHIWGVLDEFDEPLFSNARHLIGRVEHDFWTDPATLEAVDPARQSFVAGARRRIELLGDRLELFEDGDQVAGGVTAMLTPGHTPGHMSFNLAEKAFVTGDVVTTPHLGFQRPALPSGSDHDPETTSDTRVKVLEMLSDSAIPIIGYHLPGGGIGKVEREGDAFAFIPG